MQLVEDLSRLISILHARRQDPTNTLDPQRPVRSWILVGAFDRFFGDQHWTGSGNASDQDNVVTDVLPPWGQGHGDLHPEIQAAPRMRNRSLEMDRLAPTPDSSVMRAGDV